MLIRSNANVVQVDESKQRTLIGTALRYNHPSALISEPGTGEFFEIIKPGAFDQSIASRTVYAFLLHDKLQPLGSTAAGSLRLKSDEVGLHFELELGDTTYANDALSLLRSGIVEGMSFGFRPQKTTRGKHNGKTLLVRETATLLEISPVYSPAYSQTVVEARSQEVEIPEVESIEHLKWKLRLKGVKV